MTCFIFCGVNFALNYCINQKRTKTIKLFNCGSNNDQGWNLSFPIATHHCCNLIIKFVRSLFQGSKAPKAFDCVTPACVLKTRFKLLSMHCTQVWLWSLFLWGHCLPTQIKFRCGWSHANVRRSRRNVWRPSSHIVVLRAWKPNDKSRQMGGMRMQYKRTLHCVRPVPLSRSICIRVVRETHTQSEKRIESWNNRN